MSPFSPDKTMEEVSVGFGVAFPGKYELGDFEKDYEDMEDDPFVVPPPLLPLDIQLRERTQNCQMKTIFKVINMLTIFTLCLFVFVI